MEVYINKSLIICLTIVVLAGCNWAAAYALQLAFLAIAIPFAGLALALIYFFKSKGGMTSRRLDMSIQGQTGLDMSIQGQTGIRMEQESHVSGRFYIFIGFTFFTYRDYFMT